MITRRRSREHGVEPWFTIAQVGGDTVCAAVALLLAYWSRFIGKIDRIPIPGGEQTAPFSQYLAAIPVIAIVMIVCLALNRAYVRPRGRAFLDEAYGIIGGTFIGAVVLLALMSVVRGPNGFSYSRLVLVYMAVAMALLTIAVHGLGRVVLATLRRRGLGVTRALVVGSGAGADALIHRLEMFPEYGYELIGVVSDEMSVGEEYVRVPVVGGSDDLAHLVRRHNVDEVFIALPKPDHRQTLRLIRTCADTEAEFKIVPDLLEVITSGVVADDIDGIPIVGVKRSRLVGVNLLIKRIFDLVVTIILLPPAIPVIAVIAVLIKLDSPGPVLYAQERVGRHGRVFTAYKFRSMVRDAEARTGPVFAERDDPRVTRVGGVLRRTGLDEVPQVWNVLKGEMSLVGPRPERPHFVERFEEEVPGYVQRHEVPPGITGWAQLNDLRQDTPIEQRTIYDSYYVESWSLAFDIKILVTTFFRIFFHRNAY